MKKIGVLMALTLVVSGLLSTVAFAGPEDVCSGTKFDVEDLPAEIDFDGDGDIDVTITLVDDNTAHFDLSDEVVSAEVCVKAGSENQGDGPENHVITEDSDLDHTTGKELSHVSVIDVVFEEPEVCPPGTDFEGEPFPVPGDVSSCNEEEPGDEPTAALIQGDCETLPVLTLTNPTEEEVTFVVNGVEVVVAAGSVQNVELSGFGNVVVTVGEDTILDDVAVTPTGCEGLPPTLPPPGVPPFGGPNPPGLPVTL